MATAVREMTDSEVFCTVADRGSFTKAAEALELSKGAVSKYVARLETRLGTRLLNRNTRRLSLTEAGEVFYRRASGALAELREVERDVAERGRVPTGYLRISAPTFYGAEILSRQLAGFHRAFPEISVDLVLENRIVDLVDERFDAAIRIAAPIDSSLVMRKLTDIPLVTCASPDYLARQGRPDAPEDLSDHECLIYTTAPRPHEWSYLSEKGPYTVTVRGRFHLNDDHVIRQAAIDGLGIVRMPKLFLRELLDRGALVQLWPDDRAASLALAVVYPSRRELPAKVRAFTDFMVNLTH
jgi:DNA-binding transcriptional LysR family regulator